MEAFSDKDVVMVHNWKAHQDCINCVTYVPELNQDKGIIASCSFDRNVYIWDIDCNKIGSLVIGQDKQWLLNIDKMERFNEERKYAETMLDDVNEMDYETLFQKKKPDESGGQQ
jgi:WD40 repeat protein